MNRSFKLAALAASGLTNLVPALAQTPEAPDAGAVITRNVRVLTPEISRSLKIARMPTPTAALLVGSYWSCSTNSHGHEICRIKLVVCTNDQQNCVEV